MIHGDTTRSASASWIATAIAYRPPSQAHIGPARRSRGPVAATATEPSRGTNDARTSSSASGSSSTPTSAATAAISRRTRSRTALLPAASSSTAAYCSATRPTSCSRSASARAAAPMAAVVAGSEIRRSAAVSACTSSSPPTGIFSATVAGSSANHPTSLTTSGFPSDSVRIAAPEVSPIVGARNSTIASHAAMSDHSRSSSTYGSRITPVASSPVRSMRPSRSKPGASEPTRSRRAPCSLRRSAANAVSSCGMRLLSLMWPKQPISGTPAIRADSIAGTGQAGCGIRRSGPS